MSGTLVKTRRYVYQPTWWVRVPVIMLVLLLGSAALAQTAQTPSPVVLRVGVYENEPKIYVDAEGQPAGILWQLIEQIASSEGWQLIPVSCEWNECLTQLEAGQIDLMPDVASSERRTRRFDFHNEPALFSWSQIYVRPGVHVLSLLDLKGLRVAILEGSIQQDYLQELLPAFDVTAQWVMFNDLGQAFDAMARGDADAVVSNHYYGESRSVEMQLTRTPVIFLPVQIYYATAPGMHEQVLSTIDEYLIEWKENPESPYFAALSLGQETPGRTMPSWLLWSLVAMSLALLVALAFSFLLRLKVNEKTDRLVISENRLQTILNSLEAYVYIKDYSLRYQYVNRKVCEMFGLPAEKIIGKTDADFFSEEDYDRVYATDMRVLRTGERIVGEDVNVRGPDQKDHTFISVKIPLRNPDGSIYALCGISTDITEHVQVRNQLHQLAFFDPLTGLPNRSLMLDRLRHAIASREKTGYEGALLLVDLDNFKTVNDTLGHDSGDLLLVQVAKRIESAILTSDSAGRLSADEFLLLVEDVAISADDALVRVRDIAEFLREQLSRPFDVRGTEIVSTVSIGVAMFSDAEGNADELLKAADLALAAAKSGGRNMVRFFNAGMQVEVTRRTSIENALRKAIDANMLHLHLQPQVTADGNIVSLEALLRMTDSILGDVSPADFIPVAETSGLIVPLGEQVVESACMLLSKWQHDQNMKKLCLAVNVSPKQFHHPGFTEHVFACLQRYQVPGSLLVLEVTESLLIEDVETTGKKMELLGKQGVRFALDDFGTGYASLSYLKRLPLEQIKIDKSFVRDLLSDADDEAIVSMIIALGHSLDIRVIAEGVETFEQVRRLQQMGCNHFQGYYFGRPRPADDWPAILAGRNNL